MTAPAVVRFPNEHTCRNKAIRELHMRGAQYVFCRDKEPYQKGWQDKYPSVEEALKQGDKELAIILASVGLVGADVDVSQPQPSDKANSRVLRNVTRNMEVVEILGSPLATVTTPSGGTHLLYKGTGREGNMKWEYGDIRGAKGYVVLYDPVATLKAAKLAQSDDVKPVDVKQLKNLSTQHP